VIADDERLSNVELLGACDVTTRFVAAASLFGPQKGATPEVVDLLERRLEDLAGSYAERFGVDVREIAGSGAAGGLGGGLAALGATLRSGFDLVAELLGLDEAISRSDLVVTGEGRLDSTSFDGKVVGSLLSLVAGRADVVCIVGEVRSDALASARGIAVISLSQRYGRARAISETEALLEDAFADYLAGWSPRR
jgi:glycerate kinase